MELGIENTSWKMAWAVTFVIQRPSKIRDLLKRPIKKNLRFCRLTENKLEISVFERTKCVWWCCCCCSLLYFERVWRSIYTSMNSSSSENGAYTCCNWCRMFAFRKFSLGNENWLLRIVEKLNENPNKKLLF